MTAIPGAGKQDPRTPPPYVDPKDVSAEGPTVTIPRDILQGAIAASGLPSSSSELRSEGKIIGETQVPHQHKPSPTPAEERLKRIARERARKSNIAYRNRIGMECYKATKQMLFEEITCLEEEKARWKSEAVSLKTALSKAKQPQKEPEVPTRKEVLDLKVCLKQEMEKDELRRFEVKRDASTSYKCLVSELQHIFTQLKSSSFSVSYFDEEGDELTIATDRELTKAFNQMTGPLYRLTINLESEKKRKRRNSSTIVSSDSNTENDKKGEDDHPSPVMEDTDKERKKKKKSAAQGLQRELTASEPSSAAGLALREDSDSGLVCGEELVFTPEKKKDKISQTSSRKNGVKGESPVIESNAPKSLFPERPGIKIFISGKAGRKII